MALASKRLEALVDTLRTRPGHEKVRALMHELCVVGLSVPDSEVNFEIPIPEVRGRLDAIFGTTVFEFKRDLRREQRDAEDQLSRYLGERERITRSRYLGIATDGAEFVAYELRDGRLTRLNSFSPTSADPRALLIWLDSAIALQSDLPPDPVTIRQEFGRESLVFEKTVQALRELWMDARLIPEAELKRDLWHRHLEFVYGTLVDPDELFLQHTYLTIIAKTMAVRMISPDPVPSDELLAGTAFTQVGLHGAVEADFFDWVLLVPAGRELVARIAAQVGRFRLSEIQVDVLKSLYESLIDPQQRHYLGEYYTPDWLADWVCAEANPNPLETRLLDPACGSGTFLFQSVRRFLEAASRAGMSNQDALERCTEYVVGLDVHPVAVLFARVTYLLAIGPERLQARSSHISIPVYLGDALQWDVRQLLSEEEIEIAVPGGPPLRFPGSVASDPRGLEVMLRTMRQLADQNAHVRAFRSWLNANTALSDTDRRIVAESYELMRQLHEAGRNHIWTYIIRNLTRPLWLSHDRAKPDLIIGNPPWLKFNAMSPELQSRFREASQQRGLWVGGRVATHQDLSGYFFARVVERYLELNGRIAFVMPLASLTRAQFSGLRSGRFADRAGNLFAIVRYEKAWKFDSGVQPLFPVPSAVLFAKKSPTSAPPPAELTAFSGRLPSRDATSESAAAVLRRTSEAWPSTQTGAGSPYRAKFRQGATMVPRRLAAVSVVPGGKFGSDPGAPVVISRTGANDKRPWRDVPPLQGQIEKKFLRPMLLGESIAPFRILDTATAIVPWDGRKKRLLGAREALETGNPHLARWLKSAEKIWNTHSDSGISLIEQIDYYGKLSCQFPLSPLRVVYAKAGVKPAAAIVENDQAIIDHKLYWLAAGSIEEARYLVAILNSEAARIRTEGLQSEGMFGPRDFDKVMLSLPIPKYQRNNALHRKLAALSEKAAAVAGEAELASAGDFKRARRIVRQALDQAGVSRAIDDAVEMLLENQV